VSANRIAQIEQALAVLQPVQLELRDDSAKHAGHAGARDGRGHFAVRIVSARFEGLSPIKRHQAIYAALADLMQTDIHALAIQARTPAEADHSN
jgi:BolA family transcriptional regulator, general stress-responsive regulator